MNFAEVVTTSAAVAATPSRTAKIQALSGLLTRLEPDEMAIVVDLLVGEPRQGRIGIGWRTVANALDDTGPPPADPSLTIAAVDAALSRLAALAGPGSAGERLRQVGALLHEATDAERSFLTRLLTGELRQGALAGVMVDAVAKATGVPAAAVRRAAMLAGDLATAALTARTEGAAGLAAIDLRPLHGVQPMLAASSPDVATAIADVGLASVEWKLDGVRVQVHRQDGAVRVFTRNLNEVGGRLPALVALVEQLPVRSVVLDGEAIGWAEAENPDAFQETMSRFGRHAGTEELAVRFFDCLHVDGTDLLDAPLLERQAELDRVAGAWRVPSTVTDDVSEAERFFAAAVAAGHEGVMVKAVNSRYEAGRRGKAWRKVKPVHTYDLVVLAAEWGHGRRQGLLSNLHLGARGPDGSWVMVGKTFKGLTDELLAWQTEALLGRQERQTRGTVYVRPELVVEVAIDGVQTSTRYPGGIALRFARVRRYRPDKQPEEADTIETLKRLSASG